MAKLPVSPEDYPFLSDILTHNHDKVMEVYELGNLGDSTAIPRLLEIIKEEPIKSLVSRFEVRWNASDALRTIGTPEATRAAKSFYR